MAEPARIGVIPATRDQQPILANLLELYAHDFSEFHQIELGADGRYGYRHLPLYWREPHRYPFLVRVNDELGGFVLVKRGSDISDNDTVWDMAEFFILRRYRRHGIGTEVAINVWRQFQGPWEIRVMEANHSAHQFWDRAIALFTGKPVPADHVQKDGKRWRVFSFESSVRLSSQA